MARTCTICTHDSREEIDRALLGSTPQRVIAVQHGVEQSSLSRHKTAHLAPRVANSLARQEEVDADRLRAWMLGLHEQTLLALTRTKLAEDWPAVRAFIAEGRKNLELIGRLVGVLEQGPAVHIDARKQTAVLAGVETDDLRALATAAREGRLDGALSERAGVPVVEA